ncbi:MAG TPA: aldehyde dehydrogenase family protein, partial [Candidatus Limnocylindria bacterium]|nr:aldehyde dehydrogenase family protein [Candidatus Limnocylindria bacterium]
MTDAPTQLLINGEFRDAAGGATFTTRDPARGADLATVARAGAEDVDAAVEAARSAFTGAWAKTSPAKRARMLLRLAQLIDERTDELAELESRNVGKAKWQCASEIKVAVATLELFAGTAQHLYGRSHVVNPSVVTYTLREPVGVVGAIIPWNYPLMMAAWKVAPALATGNAVVLKPASATPLTALRLGELALEAGIPAGVLNVVPGPGAEVGEAIAAHPGIDKVAFTGETATGRGIAAAAADSLKRVSLELGGKSPNLVFADADIDAAVNGSL